jgi:MFS family permease
MQRLVEKLSLGIDKVIEGDDNGSLGNTDPQQTLARLQTIIRLACLATSIFVVATPIHQSRLGGSGFHLGLTFALGEFATAIARPVIGRALDHYGRRMFLRLGLFIIFVGMVVLAFGRPFTIGNPVAPLLTVGNEGALLILDIGRIIQGFGLGTLLLASYTMTADLARDTGKGGSFGSTEQAQFRGGLYGALIALPILLVNGFDANSELQITDQVWSTAFAIYAAGALLAYFMSYNGLPETRGLAVASANKSADGTQEDQLALNRINPQLYVLMAIVLFTNFSEGLKIFILKYIRDYITQNNIFIGLAYIPAAIIWGTLPARMGIFADRYGRKPPMSVGLTASGLFSLTIPVLAFLVPNPTMAIVMLTIFAALEAICYSAAVPAEQALVADMMGGEKRGTGFGLYTLAVTSGRALGPLIMGALYELNQSGPFIANAVILIIGALLVWFALKDPARQPKPT